MLHIAIVGSDDFNLVPVFNQTLDSLRGHYTPVTLHLVNRNSLLQQLAREYVRVRPACQITFSNSYEAGKYGEQDHIATLVREAGHVLYFLTPYDHDLVEVMRLAECDGVKVMGILWE